jgi:DNA-binding winged helix-turn-helix (wHTH) protein/tetratricopeptide (TPR) repeat protein
MTAVDPPSIFRFSNFEVDTGTGELRKHGLHIKLQEQPFHILVLLLRHAGQIVAREELRHTLWSDHTFVDFDRGLNRAMNKLRAALCDSAETPRFIETLHRRGYRFIASVSVRYPENPGSGTETASFSPAPERIVPESASAFLRRSTDRKRSTWPFGMIARKSVYSSAAVLSISICAAIAFYAYTRSAMGGSSAIATVAPRRSVAVLGFKNLSQRPEEAWVSTALSDWLTTQLSAGGHLRLIPSEDVARMKIELSPLDMGSLNGESVRRVGANLSTDMVVLGSYAIVGDRSDAQVRLDLRLQDAKTGNIVEAVSENGNEAHLFDLVLRAGEQLRSALGVQPVSRAEAAEVAVTLPSSRDAARLYSEGLEALRIFDAAGARDSLQRAVSAEPLYALSHSALATAWATLGYDDLAKGEAKRAFELSTNLPRAERLLVAARYHEMSRQWGEAVNIYRALFEFFPDSLDYGLGLADAQLNNGQTKDAMQTLSVLQTLPAPLGNDARIDLASARAAESQGDFKGDVACTSRAAEKARALGEFLLLAQARVDQAWALGNLGRGDEAAAAANEAERIFAKAGDRRGLAQSINYEGILKQNEGDSITAKRKYEEALRIYREIGNKLGVANELDDLGDVQFSLGDLEGSRRDYENAMAIYGEIGHENGICLTKGALSPVLLALGDNAGSVHVSREAVDICNRLGDRSKVAIALLSLGRALRLQGNVIDASAAESQAISAFEEIGDKQSAARARLILAELLFDQGQLRQAQASANSAAEEFVKARAARDAALAYAVLASVLLREGDLSAARVASEKAGNYLSKCSDREAELKVAMSTARVRALAGGLARDAVTKSFQEIASKADRLGFVPYELEPRLLLAEIEVDMGDRANARSQLEALRKEATDRGFGLIALKAAGDLKGLTPRN